VLSIDPEYKAKMLHLDTWDVLEANHLVKRINIYNHGILQDNPDAEWREIGEFQREKEELPGNKSRKSLLAQKLSTAQKRFSDQYEKVAETEGFPIDLVLKPSSEDKSICVYETASTSTGESDLSTTKENTKEKS
jgi:hypothetical protein